MPKGSDEADGCATSPIAALADGASRQVATSCHTVDAPEGNGNTPDESKIKPGVAFWIAVETHECMLPTLENMFMNMFLACGFTINDCKVNNIL